MTDTLFVAPGASLDGITVYWENYGTGRGMVTLVCWGSAWNCFFGAMPEPTIQEFFARADVGYLVTRMTYGQWLKQTKQHEKYLARIIEAVKKSLREQASK